MINKHIFEQSTGVLLREYKSAFELCDFVDGTPFGIKEEES